jgi:hypothetical protein
VSSTPAIRPGSPQWYQTCILSAHISFLEIRRSHRVPHHSTVDGEWQPFCISPETAGWGQKCETGHCHGEAARSVLAKVRGATSSHVFTQSLQHVTAEPRIHSLACWDLCFTLPQLLCRWRHQSGIFWIPPRMLSLLHKTVLFYVLHSHILSLCSSLNVKLHASQQAKLVLHILICIFFYSKLEDKKFCTNSLLYFHIIIAV